MTKLQSILHSVAVLGATIGPEFIHSAEGTNALGLALGGLEAVVQIVAAEEAAKAAAAPAPAKA